MRSILVIFITAVIVAALPQSAAARAKPSLTVNLNKLKVSREVNSPKYSRKLFKHWVDADRNGCDTRKEVLAKESLVKIHCTNPYGGVWYSAYDGKRVTSPRQLDIDHMVPLKEAWQSGAYRWNTDTRQRFANDLAYAHSLVAVTASTNRSKGDKDPAAWLPPNTRERCWYASSWIAVKYRWNMTIDRAERTALTRLIKARSCKATRLPKRAPIKLQPVKPKPNKPTPAKDGAIALCKDGTKSYASSHRGACSGHGGVKCWYDYATSTAPLCPGAGKSRVTPPGT